MNYLRTMLKAFKYRLSPNDSQRELINKHCGCARFIYNLALETKTMAYSGSKVSLSRYDLQAQLKDLKDDLQWLKEVNSQSLQHAILNLDKAYISFFKKGGFPKFKKKSNVGSFGVPQSVKLKGNKLSIPKFKEGINIVLHRPIKGKIRSATVSKTPTGKYFVSILCETGQEKPPKKEITERTTGGIDLGLKSFAVLSDGTEYDNPKILKSSLERLKVLQRRLSRKQKGSSNRDKAIHNVALLHEKIKNQRKDFSHKVSNEITNRFDSICIEDLNVNGMVKNHNLAQSISDVGWSEFVRQLRYKSEWRGKNILQIGRFQPSSKLHHSCGYINKDLSLSDREWICPNCGGAVFRDLNAAINIKNFALLKISGVGRTVEPVESLTLVGALKQEKFVRKGFA